MSFQHYEADTKAQIEQNENPYDDGLNKNHNQDFGTGPVQPGEVHRMTAEERAAALKIAQDADPGPDTLSYRSFVFTLIVLVVCMCSGDNGTSWVGFGARIWRM